MRLCGELHKKGKGGSCSSLNGSKVAWHGQESLGGRGQGGGPSPPVICLKLGAVVVQVPLHGPQVLRGVARSGDHLEPDEAQGVQDHRARAGQPDPVGRVD